MINNLLVAFDIGSSRISAAVARVDSLKQMHVVAVTSVENYGIKKSVVTNMEQTVEALRQCKMKLESLVDLTINEAYVSIHGGLCKILDTVNQVEITNGGIVSERDIENAMKACRENTLPENKEVVWLCPVTYCVDHYSGIKNPVGIRGKELSLEAKLFTADKGIVAALQNCMEAVNIKIQGIIPEPIALGKLVFNDENMNYNAGIINIGAETIDLSIYENGSICYTNHIPLGGNSITKDIMTCLSTSFAEAEKVKFQYTEKSSSTENDEEKEELSAVPRYNSGMINEIIEARAEELLSFALEEINNKKRLKEFDSIFITGGGILHFPELIAKFEEELGKPIEVIENNMLGAGNVIYSVPVGMLKVVIDTIKVEKADESNSSKGNDKKSNKGFIGKLRRIIEDLI